MYWSAAMSLKTPSRDKPNYGSFSRSASRSSSMNSCSSSVRIPQSIPEHQCVLHFASPRLQHYEEAKLAEYHELEQQQLDPASHTDPVTATVTVTASRALQMLLLASKKLGSHSSSNASVSSTSSSLLTASSPASSSSKSDFAYERIASPDELRLNRSSATDARTAPLAHLNGSFAANEMAATAARAAGDDSDQLNYWVLERERLRAKRERQHLLAKHAAVDDDEPASAWRTGAIMCSVPLLLVVLFAIFVLLAGDGNAGSSVGAPSAWEFIVNTVTGKTSDASSSSSGSAVAVAAARREVLRRATGA